jgi:hypothetical protein
MSDEGSKYMEVARMEEVSGGRTGRPKSIGFLRALKSVFGALTGPRLYEGYGFRKRAEAKPLFSTTQRWPPGFKRMPVRSGGGRYPSVSRPR